MSEETQRYFERYSYHLAVAAEIEKSLPHYRDWACVARLLPMLIQWDGLFCFRMKGMNMARATTMLECPMCKELTPHYTDGVKGKETDKDGRVFQWMTCAVASCGAHTKIPFIPGTNEFQENADLPDDSDADK